MFNLYYIFLTVFIIGGSGVYFIFFNNNNSINKITNTSKEKIHNIKKKFNIKSTETTFTKFRIGSNTTKSKIGKSYSSKIPINLKSIQSDKSNKTNISNKTNKSSNIFEKLSKIIEESSELSSKSNKTNKTNKSNKSNKININKFNIIELPANCTYSTFIYNVSQLPIKLIRDFSISNSNNNNNSHEIIFNIISAYVNSKIIFQNIFENNSQLCINDINTFISNYKIFLSKNIPGFNIGIRLFNDNGQDEKFIIMKKNILIKVNNFDNLKSIYKTLIKDKIFIMNGDNNLFISKGDIFTSNIGSVQIKNLFFSKSDISNPKINLNYNEFCKFKKISIFYWISTPISI